MCIRDSIISPAGMRAGNPTANTFRLGAARDTIPSEVFTSSRPKIIGNAIAIAPKNMCADQEMKPSINPIDRAPVAIGSVSKLVLTIEINIRCPPRLMNRSKPMIKKNCDSVGMFPMFGSIMLANMIDPNMGNIPTLSQFFLIIGLLLFMSLGGHLILISMVSTSFETLPIATGALSMGFIEGFISWSAHMFLGAIAIAFPIIFGLLLVNTSLGIVSRAAPSLNVFAVGFPALIPAGLIMLSLIHI